MTIWTWCNHHMCVLSLLLKRKDSIGKICGIFADNSSVGIPITVPQRTWAFRKRMRRTTRYISSCHRQRHMMIFEKPPFFCECVCVCDSWIRKWRVWCISDWIQIIYQTWSKIFIRLDLNLDLSDLDPRYASDSEPGRVSGSDPCVMLRLLVQMPKHSVICDEYHNMSRYVTISHVTCLGMSLREREPDHSSWYLLSLTLVIGCVTVEELFELRLYINMNVIIPSIILRDESLLIT